MYKSFFGRKAESSYVLHTLITNFNRFSYLFLAIFGDRIFLIIIPHMNFPYKTSIDERLIFYNITHCYSNGEYCHMFVIAAGDIITYQAVT